MRRQVRGWSVTKIAFARRVAALTLALAFAVALEACNQSKGDDPVPLAIIGTYSDVFGTTHVISNASWKQTFDDTGNSAFCGGPAQSIVTDTYSIVDYSNGGEFLVVQNTGMVGDCSRAGQNLWTRFDWLTSGGHLYYCQSVTADSQSAATALFQNRTTASAGCGASDSPPQNFAWTQMN